ncbi:MAG TPA: hypothetical protein DCZ12_15915, partial [Gammaproteobacteria bacterium]|nr:hypothetical protein [Gammaproteobacteria bacterium]
MPRQNVPLLAFNRGVVSPSALARVDLERMPFYAEQQENWVPHELGGMSLRPGFEFIGEINFGETYLVPFIYSYDDTAIIGIDDENVSIWVDDTQVEYKGGVLTAVANSGFDTDLASWTDADDAGGTSAWVTGGYMGLTGDGTDYARRKQTLTVDASDFNTEHGLKVVVTKGVATIRAGQTDGAKEYLDDIVLEPGTHFLAITPTTDIYLQIEANLQRRTDIDSVEIIYNYLSLPLGASGSWFPRVRTAQSADVVYLAIKDNKPKKIKRYATRSWGITDYSPEDGPFRLINTTTTTITPSALVGDITLTSSADLFKSGHVGALFRVDSIGQTVEKDVTAENQFTDAIKVTGVGTSRAFLLSIAGTFTATCTLQRSVGEPGNWQDVQSWTAPGSINLNYGLDNQTIYYRFGVKTGDFTSGTAELSLVYGLGSTAGIARITGYTSATSVFAEVLSPFGNTNPSEFWYEGMWSDVKGYPSSVSFFEGRLWWAGRQYWYGSKSDAYETFDLDLEGDDAPIIRQIGFGAVDDIAWMLPAQRLLVGTAGNIIAARSSSFEEPLTNSTFNLRQAISYGAAEVNPALIDEDSFYVDRSKQRLMRLIFGRNGFSYGAVDASVMIPDEMVAGIKKILVQRRPDTRIHCILENGDVWMHVFNPVEELRPWVKITTSGDIEDGVVLPGEQEDEVYYIIDRVDGRYMEKWAKQSECVGGTLNKQLDSFSVNASTGLDRFNSET